MQMTPEILFNRADDGADLVVKPPLSQAVGYVVVVLVGLLIATGMHPHCHSGTHAESRTSFCQV
jgi:hypothetical protein